MKWNRKEIYSAVAWIAGALLAAGVVRTMIANELTRLNEGLMISGGVLLLVWLAGSFRDLAGFFGSRSGKLGTNAIALILAFVAILGLINFLGYRHSKRWDWTPNHLYTLSDETKKVLAGLKEEVHFNRFDKKSGGDPLAETMAEYRKDSPLVTYQVVDPQARPDIARQYEVRHMGDLVVTSGTRTEHLKDTDEQSLTSGILKVTEVRQKSVCFVTGHGERSLTSSDGEGYSEAEKELERENYTVKPINLVEAKQVPAECDVVVVAGPKTGYFPEEAEALDKYLQAGGKVLAMVDPGTDPKLDPLFGPWNISVGKDLALDVSGAGQLFGLGAAVPVVTHYGSSPITEALESRMTFFPLARTVGAADKKNYQKPVTDLLFTSNRSFAKNNWDEKQKELKFEPGKDQSGPLTLGVSEERKEGPNTARLVVIGNSAFASNAFLTLQSNSDLFDNTVNWLAQDENLISIRPKAPTNRRVTLTVAQERLFYWFSLILVPGVVLVTGVVLWWKRR